MWTPFHIMKNRVWLGSCCLVTDEHAHDLWERCRAELEQQVSGGVFRVTLGSLYPALQRLERAGFIAAEWRTSDNNRRARYYEITRAGRRRLAVEQKDWARVSAAVARVLKAT